MERRPGDLPGKLWGGANHYCTTPPSRRLELGRGERIKSSTRPYGHGKKRESALPQIGKCDAVVARNRREPT